MKMRVVSEFLKTFSTFIVPLSRKADVVNRFLATFKPIIKISKMPTHKVRSTKKPYDKSN